MSIDKVVQAGACVGCGACSVITNRQIPMNVNRFGIWQADVSATLSSTRELGSLVCPFSDESPDESRLSSEQYPELQEHQLIGRCEAAFAAQVNDNDYLEGSSSGGLTSWLLLQLLERNLIDGVLHVGAADGEDLFEYVASHTPEELTSRRKSIYYSTSMAEALLAIRGNGMRYAVVGVPCFITAGRLLAHNDAELRSQLCYFVGLVCGHLKSAAFAELLAWQCGIPPAELASVDFRVKNPLRDAGSYDFEAISTAGKGFRAPTNSLFGGNWGLGLFQLDACNYCDDVFAETADIVFGDAWLPEFVSDWRGHNVVVTRHPELAQIIDDGVATGTITRHPLGPDRAADSQAGNFRHRREGLQLRLYDDQVAGLWTPRKRVKPSVDIPRRRKSVVRSRRELSSASHRLFREALDANSLEHFVKGIDPLVVTYTRAYRVSLPQRAARWAYRRLRALVSRARGVPMK